MSARPFVHLHCHTHYSLLDGANRIPELVGQAKTLGMNALAITDHGNLYGALEFYSECKSAGINPILGYEAYIAPGNRRHKEASRMKEASYHLTLLAKNTTGFKNLVKLASKAYIEGFYYKPRIDKEILAEHREGLICLSGCAAGELSNHILGNRMDDAVATIDWFRKTFGDDYYLEIQNANIEIQRQCAEGTVDLARRLGIPLVATNDTHYLRQEDAAMHDVVLCVNTHSVRTDANRMKMDGDQLFLRSPEQMYEAFPGLEDAVSRSQEIANQVSIELDLRTRHFPVFQPPPNLTDADYLRQVANEGLKWRYGDNPPQEMIDRLNWELDVIIRMGFSSYFLIVWDFARFAREKRIPCLARGSACGAIVSYVLGLSNVCPIKYDLLFERFLDPSRAEAPDIDMDFCRDRRGLVLKYVREKYGEENVAQIGTFGTLRAKAVVRDVARALGVPLAKADIVAKAVPDTLHISLEEALKDSPELKALYDGDPEVREVVDFGMKLEGLAKSAGTHAAGVVIGDKPLIEYVPLQKITGKEEVITQWTDVEKAGLLKMDFLGLRNLTILDEAVDNVRRCRGIDIDPARFPLDDRKTFELLQRGETKGVFQLESGGMRDLLTKMRPDSFQDIIATSALYRPGPLEGGMVMKYVNVKHKLEPVDKIHPVADEVLAETYGVMVYQEQVMRIINRLGGIELSKAYACIKAISKKKSEIIDKNKAEFVAGAQERGMSAAKARELFELIEKFAGYGFNKSHSTAYAAIAYQTAYLKANYPIEFMAALLSCGMEDTTRIAEHVDDCRRMKISILPPDVNRSQVRFAVEGEAIRFGMAAIRGVGEQAVAAVVAERDARGPFKDIFDLTERLDPKQLTRTVLETLIKAGALDTFGPNRNQHAAAIDRAMQGAVSKQRDKAAGQRSLFDMDGPAGASSASKEPDNALPPAPDLTQAQKLAAEKEVFGFYLTSHPLTQHSAVISVLATHTVADVVSLNDKADVRLAGMISSVKKTTTKKPSRNGNTRYANFDFEDLGGIVRCIMWPEEFAHFGDKVVPEMICVIEGKVDRRGREPNIVVNSLLTLDEARRRMTDCIALQVVRGMHDDTTLVRVRDILKRHPGGCDVRIEVLSYDDRTPDRRNRFVVKAGGEFRASATPELKAELNDALGSENVSYSVTGKKRLAAKNTDAY
jgi:DNA polymerase-3 subunit alpha